MSGTVVTPDVGRLARMLIVYSPHKSVQESHELVFEFIRFFRLKQKLNDYHTEKPKLAPSDWVDFVWRLFVSDTVGYAQACGPAERFIHRVLIRNVTDYKRLLKNTLDAYRVKYGEDAPAKYWTNPEKAVEPAKPEEVVTVLAPAKVVADVETEVGERAPSTHPTKRTRTHDALTAAAPKSQKRAPVGETFDVVAKHNQLAGMECRVRDVHRDSSVAQFQDIVARAVGIQADTFRIEVDGIPLELDKRLADYDAFTTYTNNIVVRLIGR